MRHLINSFAYFSTQGGGAKAPLEAKRLQIRLCLAPSYPSCPSRGYCYHARAGVVGEILTCIAT